MREPNPRKPGPQNVGDAVPALSKALMPAAPLDGHLQCGEDPRWECLRESPFRSLQSPDDAARIHTGFLPHLSEFPTGHADLSPSEVANCG
jgi:hypothetical protein